MPWPVKLKGKRLLPPVLEGAWAVVSLMLPLLRTQLSGSEVYWDLEHFKKDPLPASLLCSLVAQNSLCLPHSAHSGDLEVGDQTLWLIFSASLDILCEWSSHGPPSPMSRVLSVGGRVLGPKERLGPLLQ